MKEHCITSDNVLYFSKHVLMYLRELSVRDIRDMYFLFSRIPVIVPPVVGFSNVELILTKQLDIKEIQC
jgi:hypothetical protein